MKKRLLITSIVMMLVVAVALSTATYAWFTSNATVSASSITLTADTSTSTALGIGWKNGEAGTSISSNVSGTLAPMCPKVLQVGTTTVGATETTTNNIEFFTQTTKQNNSMVVFNANGDSVTPVTYSTTAANAFYIKNLSNANAISSITISAVFATDTEVAGSGNAYTYAPIMTQTITGTYYTKAANNYVWIEHTASEAINNANFAAATGTAQTGIKYYSLNTDTHVYSLVQTAMTVGSTDVSGYYTMTETNFTRTETSKASLTSDGKNGDDMVRVAIFRKNKTQVGTTGKYAWTDGDGYTLIGILGNANTQYVPVNEVQNISFDKNTNYYINNGSGYVKQTVADATAFETYTTSGNANYGKLYIATNTAVHGPIVANENVKDLSIHEVSTSLELLDSGFELAPNSTVELVAIAWLDGTVFDDSRAGDIAGVSLKFHA